MSLLHKLAKSFVENHSLKLLIFRQINKDNFVILVPIEFLQGTIVNRKCKFVNEQSLYVDGLFNWTEILFYLLRFRIVLKKSLHNDIYILFFSVKLIEQVFLNSAMDFYNWVLISRFRFWIRYPGIITQGVELFGSKVELSKKKDNLGDLPFKR